MDSYLEKLAGYFKTFPGIGKRQAERFVYHILSQNDQWIESFIKEIRNARQNVTECNTCFRIFKTNSSVTCEVCNSKLRNRKILAVVEKANDAEILLANNFFDGLVFVLGGTVPVIQKKNHKTIHAQELFGYVQRLHKENKQESADDFADFDLKNNKNLNLEVIFCNSLNPDGIFTATILKDEIVKMGLSGLKITTLGRGFSTGTEFEYADRDTLKYAFENRSTSLW
jgi:recombination protein RecR